MKRLLLFAVAMLPLVAPAQYCIPSYDLGADTLYMFTYLHVSGYGSSLNDTLSVPLLYIDKTSGDTAVSFQQGGSYSGILSYHDPYRYYENEIWIDLNDDGVFSPSERVTPPFGTPAVVTGSSDFTLNVPIEAATGAHAMRVREIATTFSTVLSDDIDPCNSFDMSTGITIQYGEGRTVDYLVKIVPLTACSSMPAAGTVTADTSTAGFSTSIMLADSGYTVAGGIVLQWQSSPDSVSWTDIDGATNGHYLFSGLTASTYFRCKVTCTGADLFSVSNGLKITYVPYYCAPVYYHHLTSGMMTYFSLEGYSGTFIHDSLPGPVLNYSNRTGTVGAVSLLQGASYSGSIAYSSASAYYENEIWIDFNNDSTFSTNETASGVFGVDTGSVSGVLYALSVPLSAPVGYHRMRVRQASTSSSELSLWMDPCEEYDTSLGTYTAYLYGLTADYLVDIIALPVCSGAPTAGTATSDKASACGTDIITLSASGASAYSGLSFQWQSSTDSSTWTNVSGATSVPYIFSGLTATTFFRLIAVCTGSGSADTSHPIKIMSSPCYCLPVYGYPGTGNKMIRFMLGGDGGYSLDDTIGTVDVFYLDHSWADTIKFGPGSTHEGIVTYDVAASFYEDQLWVDFNDDGVFSASEAISDVFGTEGSGIESAMSAFTVNIPLSASPGNHRMRVREATITVAGYRSLAMDPCGESDDINAYYMGLTVDYTAHVDSLPPCSGTPTAGAAACNNTIACATTPLVLSLEGYSAAGGLSFQWQSSPDSSAWSDIAAATTAVYSFTGISTTSYFRCAVTCLSTGSVAYSSGVKVMSSACYCIPSYTEGFFAPYMMSYFSINGDESSMIYDDLSMPESVYWDRTGSVSILNLRQDGYYSGHINYATSLNDMENDIWVDFNDDGIFDSSESITGVFGSPLAFVTSNFFVAHIPIGAAIGIHRMRVRQAVASTGDLSPAMDPCAEYDYSALYGYILYQFGAVADYLVNVEALAMCDGTPWAGTISSSTGEACPSTPITLHDTLFADALGLSWQWQSSTDSIAWNSIPGATFKDYTFSGLTGTTYYRCVMTCSASGMPDTTASVPILSGPCYCTPTYLYGYNPGFMMDSISLSGYGSTSLHDDLADPPGVYLDKTAASAYVEMMQGESYPGILYFSSSDNSYENQVWIDFDDDGVFNSSESVTPVFAFGTEASSSAFSVSIPASALPGLHRMRIRQARAYAMSAAMNACEDGDSSIGTFNPYLYGLTCDYMVRIVSNACDTVTGLAASLVSDTGASVTWHPVSGALGYEYFVSTSPAITGGTDSVTTDSSRAIGGLASGTTYYVHIRVICAAGDTSAWEILAFNTTLTVTGIAMPMELFRVRPNPAQETLYISSMGTVVEHVVITNIVGQKMIDQQCHSGNVTIDISALPEGSYLIIVNGWWTKRVTKD